MHVQYYRYTKRNTVVDGRSSVKKSPKPEIIFTEPEQE